jgi:hypothetical protein
MHDGFSSVVVTNYPFKFDGSEQMRVLKFTREGCTPFKIENFADMFAEVEAENLPVRRLYVSPRNGACFIPYTETPVELCFNRIPSKVWGADVIFDQTVPENTAYVYFDEFSSK